MLVGAPAHADPDLLDAASSAATSAITIDELLEQQLGILGKTFADTVNLDVQEALPFFGIDDTSDPATLLGNADTTLTAANTVINDIPTDLPTTFPYYGTSALTGSQLIQQDIFISDVSTLLADENTIGSHLGVLSGVVDGLYFDPVDEVILSESNMLLHADQAFATAVTSTSPDTAAILAAENAINWDSTVLNVANLLTAPITEFFGPIFLAF
ncbi:hypothetical protein [Mycobacterium sp.]|uniref:hypothetical protein n=1 Tax=Mycobacterium sp. TaxID=1785 RepID=UPI00126E52DA|nr:hypothetical protein [Mycobacterium sp.]KAA8969198.1 MAG: hypothetical protein F6Q13_03625 [Mycobacterium sp.]